MIQRDDRKGEPALRLLLRPCSGEGTCTMKVGPGWVGGMMGEWLVGVEACRGRDRAAERRETYASAPCLVPKAEWHVNGLCMHKQAAAR